ncbi:MAG: PorV/PorQ family protein [Elusimicrobiota bacterium]
MKRILVIVLLHSLSISLLGASTGGRTGELLNWGAGARSLALGKAYTAVADDGSAGYWNAAAMTQLDKKEVSMLRANLWEGTVYDFLGFVYPTVSWGAFGLSLARLCSGEAEKRDTDNIATGSFKNMESAYLFSYAYNVLHGLSVGGSLKKFDSLLDGRQNSHLGLDMNGLYEITGSNKYFNNLRLASNLQNIFSQKNGSDSADKLPMGIRLGAAAQMLNKKVLLSLDLENRLGAGIVWHLGAEYRFKYLAVRLGSDREEYSAGIGLNYQNYYLDYAYATHTLGGSQRMGLGYKFGLGVNILRHEKADNYYQEGLALIEKGSFTQAADKLAAACKYKNSPIYLMSKNRLEEVTTYFKKAEEEKKEMEELRKGVRDYLTGYDQKALDEVLYSFSLNKADERIYNLLRQMEKTTGLKSNQEALASDWSLIEQRLYKSLRYFREKQFDLAVIECQEAIKLEPANVLAYKRLGSAFYALGKRDKAKEAWLKVLELAPNEPGNDKLKILIDSIK